MTNKTIIYHNAQCSKSCESLDLLKQSAIEIEIIDYLKDAPSLIELRKIVDLLGIKSFDLVRKNEQEYLDYFSDQELSDDEWIRVMHDYPQLIERPIVISGDRAIIGRPPSLVLTIL